MMVWKFPHTILYDGVRGHVTDSWMSCSTFSCAPWMTGTRREPLQLGLRLVIVFLTDWSASGNRLATEPHGQMPQWPHNNAAAKKKKEKSWPVNGSENQAKTQKYSQCNEYMWLCNVWPLLKIYYNNKKIYYCFYSNHGYKGIGRLSHSQYSQYVYYWNHHNCGRTPATTGSVFQLTVLRSC